MSSSKKGIKSLVEICARKGVIHAVISPGSRNAPLSISLDDHEQIDCFQITDERVAAFFALGLSQQSKKATILSCTSGTAVLNYAPAIAEAYYQRIPLIILTADRPVQWIDQGAGQSINQKNIFQNYIRKSFELPQKISRDQDQWYNDRMINEALNIAHGSVPGPVHINIPLEEPLYNQDEIKPNPKIIEAVETKRALTPSAHQQLLDIWKSNPKKLIICGMMQKSKLINDKINALANDHGVVVLSESHSNVNGPNIFQCIDRLITSFTDEDIKDFNPDLLISFGHSIISKKVKALLNQMEIQSHWHIDSIDIPNDTFRQLTHHIKMAPADFLSAFIPEKNGSDALFQKRYLQREARCLQTHDDYLSTCKFSDLYAFSRILKVLPEQSMLQMGNSASVRYVQLFNQRTDIAYYANRGVSGIEGCTSTACGASWLKKGFTTLITGDLGFLYDSNGLWHQYINADLRIIVINNQGGGIFRIIEGPSSTEQFEKYFEANHDFNAKANAHKFGLEYLSAHSKEELDEALSHFYNASEHAKVLEVFTPRKENDKILKHYFEHISRLQ